MIVLIAGFDSASGMQVVRVHQRAYAGHDIGYEGDHVSKDADKSTARRCPFTMTTKQNVALASSLRLNCV
jgi:hypothetical protein